MGVLSIFDDQLRIVFLLHPLLHFLNFRASERTTGGDDEAVFWVALWILRDLADCGFKLLKGMFDIPAFQFDIKLLSDRLGGQSIVATDTLSDRAIIDLKDANFQRCRILEGHLALVFLQWDQAIGGAALTIGKLLHLSQPNRVIDRIRSIARWRHDR
jgi:hypothetical protein